MTAGWGETEVPMDVSPRRLAPVQHRHLPARDLLSMFSFLRAFLLAVIKRNQAQSLRPAPSRCAAARSARTRKADEHERGGAHRVSRGDFTQVSPHARTRVVMWVVGPCAVRLPRSWAHVDRQRRACAQHAEAARLAAAHAAPRMHAAHARRTTHHASTRRRRRKWHARCGSEGRGGWCG